jgi:hypothetical protein
VRPEREANEPDRYPASCYRDRRVATGSLAGCAAVSSDDEVEWRRREALMQTYSVGEVVLMEWQGWLKAFRVVEVLEGDSTNVEYRLELLDTDSSDPGWIRPAS